MVTPLSSRRAFPARRAAGGCQENTKGNKNTSTRTSIIIFISTNSRSSNSGTSSKGQDYVERWIDATVKVLDSTNVVRCTVARTLKCLPPYNTLGLTVAFGVRGQLTLGSQLWP